MKEICPNCKSERYERIDIHSSDAYTGLTINKFGRIDLNVCRDCGVVYLKREQFEKINKTRLEDFYEPIKRTSEEILILPTWEEVCKQKEHMKEDGVNPIGAEFKSKDGYKISMLVYKNCDSEYIINVAGEDFTVYYAELTKENYTLACRKCKELFLGGNNEKI